MNPKAIEIANRLQDNPELLTRVESLLDIVEDASGDLKKAADAEMRVIEELRKMGNEALTSWGKRQSDKAAVEANQDPTTRRMGKKTFIGTAVTEKSS